MDKGALCLVVSGPIATSSTKHEIKLGEKDLDATASVDNSTFCVKHILSKAHEITGISTSRIKLIAKGKSLSDPDASLSSLGISSGAKIMLIAAPCAKDDPKIEEIFKSLQHKHDNLESKLQEISFELRGLTDGYLPSDHHTECLKSLTKRVESLDVACLKLLTEIDAIELPKEADNQRSKRKRLVESVQKLLTRKDEVFKTITNHQSNKNSLIPS